jgi:hypothetical protein
MVAVLLLALAVVIMYIRVTRKYVNLRTAGVGDKDETIIGNATKIADKILEDAKAKSKLMLDASQHLSGKYTEYFDETIKNANKDYLNRFNEVLLNSQTKLLQGINDLSGSVAGVINQDIVVVREAIISQLTKMQAEIQTEVAKTYESLELNLTSYKKARMAQIDQAIFDIIEEVSRKVLEKEISAEEHEKLVMKALEEAKNQNVFFSDNGDTESEDNRQKENAS